MQELGLSMNLVLLALGQWFSMTYTAMEERKLYWTAPTALSIPTTAEYWKMWEFIAINL